MKASLWLESRASKPAPSAVLRCHPDVRVARSSDTGDVLGLAVFLPDQAAAGQ